VSHTGAVRIVELPARPTAVVAVVTSPEEYPSLWGGLLTEVWETVRALGVHAGRNVMLYKDPRPSVEVGVELLEPFTAHGRVTPSALPAGRAALTLAPGAPTPEGIAAAHDRIRSWCAEHGHTPTGVCWEIYGHWSQDPSRMYTEAYHALT
jgi:hypothetical protein